MSFERLTRAAAILRHGDEMEKVGGTAKDVLKGAAEGVGGLVRGTFRGAASVGAKASAKGYKGVGTAIKYAPHLALAAGAHHAYTSPTGQRLRYKLREMKARREARKAGYY